MGTMINDPDSLATGIVSRFGTLKERFVVTNKPVLELVDQNGNAFVILGRAIRAAKKDHWDQAQIDVFLNEARSGDYDHLLRTCMKYFDVQ